MRSLSNSRRFLLCGLTVSALLIGCGDDGDDDVVDAMVPDAMVPESPVQKCERLASTYCLRLASCWRQANNTSESEEQTTRNTCERDFLTRAMCSRAIGVTATYDQCLGLVPTGPCVEYLSTAGYIPTACMGVISTPADAGT